MARKAKKTAMGTDVQLSDESIDKNGSAADVQSDSFWRYGSFAVLFVAAALRFYWLAFKPFHHDEGVNGWFLTNLFRNGVYHYDPENYHGPTLYYFALASTYLFGLNDFAVRFVTALFGILIVAAVLSLRRYIGTIGALTAALLIAVSPGMTFISRYFIHEILFVFFTLAVAVGIVKFMERETVSQTAIVAMTVVLLICLLPGTLNFANSFAAGNTDLRLAAGIFFFAAECGIVFLLMRSLIAWDNGKAIYLLLAAACAALTFASKETAFISFGTMLIAVACVAVWMRIVKNEINGQITLNVAIVLLHAAVAGAIVYYYKDLWRNLVTLSEVFNSQIENKDNYLVLSAIIILISAGLAVWFKFVWDIWQSKKPESRLSEPINLSFETFSAALGEPSNAVWIIALALMTFAFVWVLFFSSFFTHPEGIGDSFKAYYVWTKTGTKDHADNGLFAYLKWGAKIEAPLLVLSAIGSLIAFWKAKHKFAMFAALWAFGLFAAYTIIPYKTPWLAINYLLPMAIIAGYGINEIAAAREKWMRLAAAFLVTMAIGIAAFQSIEINFYRYDDDTEPYVYAHTRRDYTALIAKIEETAERAGTKKDASIIVVSPDYWAMPWTLRNYPKAGFYGKFPDEPISTKEMIVAKIDQEAEVEEKYGAYYTKAGTYDLRPGVELLLYVRKDLMFEP